MDNEEVLQCLKGALHLIKQAQNDLDALGYFLPDDYGYERRIKLLIRELEVVTDHAR